ncbi:hypothetical protein TRVA0_072S00320 [Trichomonascus vanleenenianus]|uniref:uncharacterized protein n=1 Tax=Trichomonascus vanleenenianus TaxID=2268995 RepID=UPI003ECB6B1C
MEGGVQLELPKDIQIHLHIHLDFLEKVFWAGFVVIAVLVIVFSPDNKPKDLKKKRKHKEQVPLNQAEPHKDELEKGLLEGQQSEGTTADSEFRGSTTATEDETSAISSSKLYL